MRFLAVRARHASVVLVATTICIASLFVQPAFGVPAATKIEICHATSSQTNPYRLIKVGSAAAVTHEAHDGDVIPAPAGGCHDRCPNVDGTQVIVPESLVPDAEGNCVPNDVCPNIAEAQSSVPSGYYVDNNGDCVPKSASQIACESIGGTYGRDDQVQGPDYDTATILWTCNDWPWTDDGQGTEWFGNRELLMYKCLADGGQQLGSTTYVVELPIWEADSTCVSFS